MWGEGKPRRLVTGLRPDGTSYFARIEEVDEVDYGAAYPGSPRHNQIWRIWAWDHLPIELPVDGRTADIDPAPTPEGTPDALRRSSSLPPVTGSRVTVVKFAPAPSGARIDANGLGGFHWGDAVIVQWLLAGDLVMKLDDGEEVTLRPGDVCIQNGTSHAWEIRTVDGAVLGLVVLPAERVGAIPRSGRRQERPASSSARPGP